MTTLIPQIDGSDFHRANPRRRRVDFQCMQGMSEITDYILPFTLRVIAQLGVADLLREGPRSIEDLAEQTGTHAPSLHRALRAAASHGVFEELDDGRYGLTRLAQPLRTDHPYSMAAGLPLLESDMEAWAHVDHAVKTGEPSFEFVHGMSYFDYLDEHPDVRARFDEAQRASQPIERRILISAFAWAGFPAIVEVADDVELARAVVRRFQGVEVMVATDRDVGDDIPAGVEVIDRDGLPQFADLYVIRRQLATRPDADALQLLRHVRDVMGSHSRLLVIEPLIHPGNAPSPARLYDAMLMTMGPAKVREVDEMDALLAEAGFGDIELHDAGVVTMIVASPDPRA